MRVLFKNKYRDELCVVETNKVWTDFHSYLLIEEERLENSIDLNPDESVNYTWASSEKVSREETEKLFKSLLTTGYLDLSHLVFEVV